MADLPTRRQHLTQVLGFSAAVLGFPALLRTRGVVTAQAGEDGAEGNDEHTLKKQAKRSLLGNSRQPFDSRPRRVLSGTKPDYLFFGDSMARAHIDADAATRVTGKPCSVFYLAHSTSARWYLMLKNYVIPSAVRPKKMIVLFRNCLWHMPSYRIDGTCWDDLERNMEDPADPVIAQVIGLEPRRGASPAAQFLRDEAYPVQTHGEGMRQSLQAAAAKLCGLDFEHAKALANARTSWEHFRGGITAEVNYDGLTELAPFSMDRSKTFLPHFIDLAKEAGIPLHFVRIRRRPLPDGRVPNPKGIDQYMAELKAEVVKQGCDFTDLNDDTELKLEMYAEGDHLDMKHSAWFTERLVKRLGLVGGAP
jgi:hypothetical protein